MSALLCLFVNRIFSLRAVLCPKQMWNIIGGDGTITLFASQVFSTSKFNCECFMPMISQTFVVRYHGFHVEVKFSIKKFYIDVPKMCLKYSPSFRFMYELIHPVKNLPCVLFHAIILVTLL